MTLALPDAHGATRLVLVRHAETEGALRGRCYGRLDVALSEDGVAQAAALAGALAGLPLRAVYASPLARALETARPIAAARGLVPVVDARLRELDFGELEGLPYERIAAERPALFREWMESPGRVRFPGGEALADLRRRVRSSIEWIRRRHSGEAVAVVSHGGPLRVVLADAQGLDDAALFAIEQPFGAVTVVDWGAGEPVVRAVDPSLYSAAWQPRAAR
jgi:broad specificity phosphatase PhoE